MGKIIGIGIVAIVIILLWNVGILPGVIATVLTALGIGAFLTGG